MVDTHELRAQLFRRGYSISRAAQAIGLTPPSLYHKFKNGKFTVDDADKLTRLLSLSDPAAIFFAPDVNCQVTAQPAGGVT